MKVNNFIASLLFLMEFESISLGFESFELKERLTMDGAVLKSTTGGPFFIFMPLSFLNLSVFSFSNGKFFLDCFASRLSYSNYPFLDQNVEEILWVEWRKRREFQENQIRFLQGLLFNGDTSRTIESRTEKAMRVAYLILNEDEEKIVIEEKNKLKEKKKKESSLEKEPEMVKEEDLSPS